MGSSNFQCGISQLPIEEGTPVYFGIIRENEKAEKYSGCYIGAAYHLVTPLMRCVYGGYGLPKSIPSIHSESDYKIPAINDHILRELVGHTAYDGVLIQEMIKEDATQEDKDKVFYNQMYKLFTEQFSTYGLVDHRFNFSLNQCNYWRKENDGLEPLEVGSPEFATFTKERTDRLHIWMVRKDVVDELLKLVSEEGNAYTTQNIAKAFVYNPRYTADGDYRDDFFKNEAEALDQYYGLSRFCTKTYSLHEANPRKGKKPKLEKCAALKKAMTMTARIASLDSYANFCYHPFFNYSKDFNSQSLDIFAKIAKKEEAKYEDY